MDTYYTDVYLCWYHLKVVFYFVLLFQVAICSDNEKENFIAVRAHGGFVSLAGALSEFTDPKFQNDNSVQGLLRIYRTNCPMYFGKYPDRQLSSRHIFVAVEGTHRITRNVVSTRLATQLNGKHLFSPPKFMTQTRLVHNDTSDMKRAFFMLGIYGTAHTVRDIIANVPVVTAGYYVDQLAFSIASAFPINLPNRTSALYKWPKDLLKPDIMFLVNTPSQLSKKTLRPDTFRGRIVQIYRMWEEPPLVIEVNHTNVYSSMVDHMEKIIRTQLRYTGSPTMVAPNDDINYCFHGENKYTEQTEPN